MRMNRRLNVTKKYGESSNVHIIFCRRCLWRLEQVYADEHITLRMGLLEKNVLTFIGIGLQSFALNYKFWNNSLINYALKNECWLLDKYRWNYFINSISVGLPEWNQ